MEYFDSRATVRKYTEEELSDAELNEMLEAATHAPTCGGMQLYTVVVTRSAEGRKALAPAHFNQPMVTEAAAVLTFCADFNRFCRWCESRGAKPGYANFQSFISAMLDTTIVAQQFVTIAEMRGWGTCYLGTTTWNAPQIIEALELPELTVPIITVTIGRPAEHTAPQPRIPADAAICREKYRAAGPDDAYGALEALEQSRRYTAENDKPTLAHVFTDIRYPREANEHFSELFLQVLKQQKFL